MQQKGSAAHTLLTQVLQLGIMAAPGVHSSWHGPPSIGPPSSVGPPSSIGPPSVLGPFTHLFAAQ